MLNGNPFVLGINRGADILQKIYNDINCLKIDCLEYQIKEKNIVTTHPYRHKFVLKRPFGWRLMDYIPCLP